jgi:alkylation response protein AidB-like acyl-CoA dehydrogenase
MNFELSDTQVMFRNMARDFATREVKPVAMAYDQNPDPRQSVPLDLIKKGFAQDFHKMVVPVKYGGLGLDAVTACLMIEELAVGDPGYATLWHVNNIAITFLLNAGNDKLIEKFLPMIVEGEGGVGALSTTEPDGGVSSAQMVDMANYAFATNARREGNDWLLNGSKVFCSNGGLPFCKWVMAFARIDMTKTGMAGTSAFLVPTNAPGFKLVGEENKMGQRLANTQSLKFDNIRIPDADRLQGGFRPQVSYEHDSAIAAIAIGCARSAYEAALDYAKKRVILGKPIIKYELIQAKIADMFIGLEAARSLMYRTASYSDTHPMADQKLARSVKVFASETANKVVSEALQIFGGSGYSKGTVVEKAYRDIRVTMIYEGTNEVQRISLAQMIEAAS